MATDRRVVVAVDVDGVLLPRGEPDDLRRRGFEARDLTLPADLLPDSVYMRGGGRVDLSGRVWMRESDGEWLRSLLDDPRVDLRWATTWEAGVRVLEQMLGLPEIPFVAFSQLRGPYQQRIKVDTGQLKGWALADVFRERDLLLLDDEVPDSTRRAGSRMWWQDDLKPPGGMHRWLRVDGYKGLRATDLSEVRRFVEWAWRRSGLH